MKYYHGGAPDLQVGDRILPPVLTGAPSLQDFGAGVCRKDRVYVTTDWNAAGMYAAMHHSGRGTIYTVAVDADRLEPDPDCGLPGLAYEVPEALIVDRYRLAPSDVKKIRRMVTR